MDVRTAPPAWLDNEALSHLPVSLHRLWRTFHTHRHPCTRASLARTQTEKQIQTPRASASTGMISNCRIILPVDVQGFHLALLSRHLPFPGALNLNLVEGLILILRRAWLRTGATGIKTSNNRVPLGLGWRSISGFKQFPGVGGSRVLGGSGWPLWRIWKCLQVQKSI